MEALRTIMLFGGWPMLIVGGFFFAFQAHYFYKKTEKLALGKLIIIETLGILISMVSLGIVATVFLLHDLDIGVKTVLPIFIVWFVVMVMVYVNSRKWSDEASKINILYYKIKERSKELQEEKTKLSHVAQNMNTGAILLDNAGKVIFVNREAKNILGFDSDDTGEMVGALYQKFSKHKLKDNIKECMAGHPANMLDVEVDGKIFEIFLRPLTDHNNPDKTYFGHFIWIRDVTEEKELEKSKYKFITVASHKLRTPLTGIKGFLDLILSEDIGKLNNEQKNYLKNIQDATLNMVDLSNQLLRASESETGSIKPKNSAFDLGELAEEIVEEVKNLNKGEACNLKLQKPSEGLESIKSDPELIGQVIKILVDNAFKYSRKDGNCEVVIKIEDKENGYVISVADKGIGIPEKDKSKIFVKFVRAENAMRMYTEGVGINLNIAKNIMKALSGRIWFESKEGEGSIFYISIPKV